MVTLFIAGDVNSVNLITGLPTLLLDLTYSRSFELEANNYALEQLHKNGISVGNFSIIMQRLENYHSTEENDASRKAGTNEPHNTGDSFSLDFLSTHPNTSDRISLVEQFKNKHLIK